MGLTHGLLSSGPRIGTSTWGYWNRILRMARRCNLFSEFKAKVCHQLPNLCVMSWKVPIAFRGCLFVKTGKSNLIKLWKNTCWECLARFARASNLRVWLQTLSVPLSSPENLVSFPDRPSSTTTGALRRNDNQFKVRHKKLAFLPIIILVKYICF